MSPYKFCLDIRELLFLNLRRVHERYENMHLLQIHGM